MPGSSGIELPGEHLLQLVAFAVAMVAEAIAVLIIALALAVAAWGTVKDALHRGDDHPWTDVRLELARSLALGLEFLLAADVIRTAVAPTWEDIGKLAAIAVIRTGLNFFLHREIREVEGGSESGRETGSGPQGVRSILQRERRAS